ncbi:indoleamine 2, 3-dioxyganeseb, partial [Moniliophthora roreri]
APRLRRTGLRSADDEQAFHLSIAKAKWESALKRCTLKSVHDIAPSSAETQTLDLVSRLKTLTTNP